MVADSPFGPTSYERRIVYGLGPWPAPHGSGYRRIESLVEVTDDIVDVFDADTEPDRLRSDPGLALSGNLIDCENKRTHARCCIGPATTFPDAQPLRLFYLATRLPNHLVVREVKRQIWRAWVGL